MTKLRMKCPYCGCWNRFEVDKIFVLQPSSEPKVKVLIPVYKPLKTERCEKCGKVMAEPKELIRISARERILSLLTSHLKLKMLTESFNPEYSVWYRDSI